jgi:hypothetical protein
VTEVAHHVGLEKSLLESREVELLLVQREVVSHGSGQRLEQEHDLLHQGFGHFESQVFLGRVTVVESGVDCLHVLVEAVLVDHEGVGTHYPAVFENFKRLLGLLEQLH